jgi:hypothetical protein
MRSDREPGAGGGGGTQRVAENGPVFVAVHCGACGEGIGGRGGAEDIEEGAAAVRADLPLDGGDRVGAGGGEEADGLAGRHRGIGRVIAGRKILAAGE